MATETSGIGTAMITTGGSFLNGNSALCVVLWIKSDVIATDHGFLQTYSTGPDGTDQAIGCRYDLSGASGGGSNLIKLCIDAGTKINSGYESASGVQTTSLQSLIFQWSSGNQETLYIDGVLDTPTFRASAYSGTTVNCNTVRMHRGGKDEASNWNGIVYEFRVYDRILTQNEITSIATMKGQDSIKNNLVLLWHGDKSYPNQSVSTVTDRSGEGRGGTASGTPIFAEDLIHVRRRRNA